MSILNLDSPWSNYVADCVLFTRIGFHIPMGWALFWVTPTSVIQKKDDFMFGTRHSPMDPGKTAVFHSFFPHVLEVAQSDYTRRDSTALGVIRTLSTIDRFFFSNLPMAEARDFHCYSHVFAQQYASSFRSPQIEDTRGNVFPAVCPNIPFSVPCCSSFMTSTGSLMTRFVHLQNLRSS